MKRALIVRHTPFEGAAGFRLPIEEAGYQFERINVSDPEFASLNLAQAVQVLAYEVRIALLAGASPLPAQKSDRPASSAELDVFFEHLEKTLDAIDFHKGRSPTTVMLRLRRLYLRAQPDERELRILHGILTDTERMARLARND